MFGPKKTRVSKDQLKKAVVNANNKLVSANNELKKNIDSNKERVKVIEADYDAYQQALKDTQELHIYATNELEATQFSIAETETSLKKALKELAKVTEDNNFLKESNKKLEAKSTKLVKKIETLEDKENNLKKATASLKQIKKEEADGQETLELLAIELNNMESGVEAYIARKEAAESEFKAFKDKISGEKEKVLTELSNIKDRMANSTLACGKEMGRLDNAIAERIAELQEMDELLKQKDFEFTTIQSKISIVENRIKDADDEAKYIVNKAKDHVSKIKSDFKGWKIEALDQVAKLKLKGKIDTIDKAGLKEVLDG